MPSAYIHSSDNRHYVAKEDSPGVVPPIAALNQMALLGLRLSTSHVIPKRNDKWGTRSVGDPIRALQRESSFQFSTYHYVNSTYPNVSPYGVLLEAALGGDALYFAGGTVDFVPYPNQVRLASQHGLEQLMAISCGGEIRFVKKVIDAHTIELNTPFSIALQVGTVLTPAITYRLSKYLKTFSVFDYWSPEQSTHRIGRGAAVDKMKIEINGDFHTLSFLGPMVDVIDSTTFESGLGGLSMFPAEPLMFVGKQMPVPGHLGQAYIGGTSAQTLLEADVALSNGLDGKGREFGSTVASAFVPGRRSVSFSASLYVKDDVAMRVLYGYAWSRTAVPVMLQLGDRAGELMGVYMPSVVPAIPAFDDRDNRLIWRFEKGVAHGQSEDELCIGMA